MKIMIIVMIILLFSPIRIIVVAKIIILGIKKIVTFFQTDLIGRETWCKG